MSKITYANKVAINENAEISDINKVTDNDMNEIKTVVNNNDDDMITINTNLTNATTYSTTEEIVGTWIDGKPIYRKVYEIGSMNANTERSINLSDISFDTIISIEGFEKSNQFSYIPIVIYNVNYNWVFVEAQTLKFKVSWAATNVYIILEYTKTPD